MKNRICRVKVVNKIFHVVSDPIVWSKTLLMRLLFCRAAQLVSTHYYAVHAIIYMLKG